MAQIIHGVVTGVRFTNTNHQPKPAMRQAEDVTVRRIDDDTVLGIDQQPTDQHEQPPARHDQNRKPQRGVVRN